MTIELLNSNNCQKPWRYLGEQNKEQSQALVEVTFYQETQTTDKYVTE